jgi:hypothetical protein
MRKGHLLVVEIFLALWSTLAIFGITWGTTYNWPDFVHTDYGIPFKWGTHMTSTIIGPIDKWNANLATLTMDIVFWTLVAVTGISLIELIDNRSHVKIRLPSETEPES